MIDKFAADQALFLLTRECPFLSEWSFESRGSLKPGPDERQALSHAVRVLSELAEGRGRIVNLQS